MPDEDSRRRLTCSNAEKLIFSQSLWTRPVRLFPRFTTLDPGSFGNSSHSPHSSHCQSASIQSSCSPASSAMAISSGAIAALRSQRAALPRA